MATVQETEQRLRNEAAALSVAEAAYAAVWQSYGTIDASNVAACRRVALAAAIAAYQQQVSK